MLLSLQRCYSLDVLPLTLAQETKPQWRLTPDNSPFNGSQKWSPVRKMCVISIDVTSSNAIMTRRFWRKCVDSRCELIKSLLRFWKRLIVFCPIKAQQSIGAWKLPIKHSDTQFYKGGGEVGEYNNITPFGSGTYCAMILWCCPAESTTATRTYSFLCIYYVCILRRLVGVVPPQPRLMRTYLVSAGRR